MLTEEMKKRQWEKGQSGNPKGRPKKEYCLTDILKEQGNIEDVETNGGKISRKQAIARKLWAMAMEGDVTALKYLYDRVDGRPKETITTAITQINNPIHEMLQEVIAEFKETDSNDD